MYRSTDCKQKTSLELDFIWCSLLEQRESCSYTRYELAYVGASNSASSSLRKSPLTSPSMRSFSDRLYNPS